MIYSNSVQLNDNMDSRHNTNLPPCHFSSLSPSFSVDDVPHEGGVAVCTADAVSSVKAAL